MVFPPFKRKTSSVLDELRKRNEVMQKHPHIFFMLEVVYNRSVYVFIDCNTTNNLFINITSLGLLFLVTVAACNRMSGNIS